MAIFHLDIEKRLGSEFWSNRYILLAADLAEANTFGEAITDAERAFHAVLVLFTRYRVSSATPDDGVYSITAVNQNGLRSLDAGGLLPLFNTLRVDFTAETGRPSRKYYRGVLSEGDISGDAVVTDFQSLLIGIVDSLAVGLSNGIVDPQSQKLLNAIPHPYVQMRQLRRSRRKRTNGGGIFQ